jgi:hypothetical protein
MKQGRATDKTRSKLVMKSQVGQTEQKAADSRIRIGRADRTERLRLTDKSGRGSQVQSDRQTDRIASGRQEKFNQTH